MRQIDLPGLAGSLWRLEGLICYYPTRQIIYLALDVLFVLPGFLRCIKNTPDLLALSVSDNGTQRLSRRLPDRLQVFKPAVCGIKIIHACFRLYPQQPLPVFHNTLNPVVLQAAGIVLFVSEHFKTMPIVAIETIVSRKPQLPMPVLQHIQDPAVGQSVAHGEVFCFIS